MSELLRAFRFEVQLFESQQAPVGAVGVATTAPFGKKIGDGGFQECSGLELEADVKEYLEGGRNDEVIRRPGRVKLQPIVLKRGMFTVGEGGEVNVGLWRWFQSIVSGARPVVRCDGLISTSLPDGRATARWALLRALPGSLKGPSFDAIRGEVAIETLHLHVEKLIAIEGWGP